MFYNFQQIDNLFLKLKLPITQEISLNRNFYILTFIILLVSQKLLKHVPSNILIAQHFYFLKILDSTKSK